MPVQSLKSLFVLRLFSVGAVRLWGWSDTTCGGQRTPLGVSSLPVHEGQGLNSELKPGSRCLYPLHQLAGQGVLIIWISEVPGDILISKSIDEEKMVSPVTVFSLLSARRHLVVTLWPTTWRCLLVPRELQTAPQWSRTPGPAYTEPFLCVLLFLSERIAWDLFSSLEAHCTREKKDGLRPWEDAGYKEIHVTAVRGSLQST